MRRRHAGPGRRSRTLRPVAAAAVLVLGLVCAAAFTGVTAQENALGRTIAAVQSEIAGEQAKNDQLKASAAEKQTSEYVIRRAQDYGFVKQGEGLIEVQRDGSSLAQARAENGQPSRMLRWIALFFGAR